MPITKSEVANIAQLANLELTPAETESFAGQLSAIVAYIDQLNELDTSSVKPWQPRSAGEASTSFVTREDVVEPSIGIEKAMQNAPDADAGQFLVPRVIG